MDPVCHTLVGAALGRAGLARRSALGMAALVLGANLPDVDALAYFGGPGADLAFRRGWTHGVLALAVLPAVLAGSLVGLHRLARHLSGAALPSAIRPRRLLLLSYLSVVTHPVLDTLNTYGVRWLMPFSERWFYGDTLFIVDPWVWLALGAGLYFGRKRRAKNGFRVDRTEPSRLALLTVTGYVVLMAVSGRVAERVVAREVARDAERGVLGTAAGGGGATIGDVMVGPRPVTPFSRAAVVARGDRYVTGAFRWIGRPHLVPGSVREFPRGVPNDDGVRDALGTPDARRFLRWARFPIFNVRRTGGGRVVDVIDLRYASVAADGMPAAPRGFGVLTIPVSGAATPTASPPRRDSLPPSSSAGRSAPVP